MNFRCPLPQNGDHAAITPMKRAKTHLPLRVPKPRNPVARSPLLGKGGAHGKSTAARRRAAKVLTAKLARDPEAGE